MLEINAKHNARILPQRKFERYSKDTHGWNWTLALNYLHFSFIGWRLNLVSMTSFVTAGDHLWY